MKRELIKSIREKEVQLSKLKAHVDKSSVCSDLYNKVVLEKAILKKELEDVENAYLEVTGEEMTKFYRPPQGKYSEANLKMAQELEYKTFFWSLAYVDWYDDNQPSREEAFEKLLGRIHPGAIVLLHSTSDTNALILDELIQKWEEMGYTIRSLTELL